MQTMSETKMTMSERRIMNAGVMRAFLRDKLFALNPRTPNQVAWVDVRGDKADLYISNCNSGKELRRDFLSRIKPTMLQFSSQGSLLALGHDCGARIYGGSAKSALEGFLTGFNVNFARFSPDENRILFGNHQQGSILFAEVYEGNLCWEKRLPFEIHPLAPVHFQGDDLWLYGKDCQRVVVKAHTGEEISS